MSSEEEEFIAALQHKEYIILKFTKLPYGGSFYHRPVWSEYGLPITEKSEWMNWKELINHPHHNDSNNGWLPFLKQNAKNKGFI